MTRVTGDLKIITGTAEAVTEVWVRSKVARPVPGGWLMTANDRKPVFEGKLDVELLPGACVLVAVCSGTPGDSVELVVPESGTASLEACIRAAEAAGDVERDALDELRRDFGAWIDEARKSVSAAGESATAAKVSADAAEKSESNAGKSASAAKDSADAAGESASAAKSDAGKANTSATTAATHASNAGKSATSAKADADRAATIASSTSWDGDKLTVNGKTSPSLTGPKGATGSRGPRGYKGDKGDPGPRGLKGDKGDTGEKGTSGASTWDAITGKPGAFPPERHKHKVVDITDLPKISDTPISGSLAQRLETGAIRCTYPRTADNAANKEYVDMRDAATLAEAKKLVESLGSVVANSGFNQKQFFFEAKDPDSGKWRAFPTYFDGRGLYSLVHEDFMNSFTVESYEGKGRKYRVRAEDPDGEFVIGSFTLAGDAVLAAETSEAFKAAIAEFSGGGSESLSSAVIGIKTEPVYMVVNWSKAEGGGFFLDLPKKYAGLNGVIALGFM